MNKKNGLKKQQKTSTVCRVKTKHEIFYKNLDPNKKDLNRGMKRGEEILTKFLGKSNGDKFTKFVLQELDELNELIQVKYGSEVFDFFFPISEYYRSALSNGGKPKLEILENFVNARKKEGEK